VNTIKELEILGYILVKKDKETSSEKQDIEVVANIEGTHLILRLDAVTQKVLAMSGKIVENNECFTDAQEWVMNTDSEDAKDWTVSARNHTGNLEALELPYLFEKGNTISKEDWETREFLNKDLRTPFKEALKTLRERGLGFNPLPNLSGSNFGQNPSASHDTMIAYATMAKAHKHLGGETGSLKSLAKEMKGSTSFQSYEDSTGVEDIIGTPESEKIGVIASSKPLKSKAIQLSRRAVIGTPESSRIGKDN
jgi:hypothetical protein